TITTARRIRSAPGRPDVGCAAGKETPALSHPCARARALPCPSPDVISVKRNPLDAASTAERFVNRVNHCALKMLASEALSPGFICRLRDLFQPPSVIQNRVQSFGQRLGRFLANQKSVDAIFDHFRNSSRGKR